MSSMRQAAHRAVVDVDVELGLVRVVEMATAQDVGKAMNPVAVDGQIEGGTVQGLGLLTPRRAPAWERCHWWRRFRLKPLLP